MQETPLAMPGLTGSRLTSLVSVFLLGTALAACSGGDFGRVRQDARNDVAPLDGRGSDR